MTDYHSSVSDDNQCMCRYKLKSLLPNFFSYYIPCFSRKNLMLWPILTSKVYLKADSEDQFSQLYVINFLILQKIEFCIFCPTLKTNMYSQTAENGNNALTNQSARKKKCSTLDTQLWQCRVKSQRTTTLVEIYFDGLFRLNFYGKSSSKYENHSSCQKLHA